MCSLHVVIQGGAGVMQPVVLRNVGGGGGGWGEGGGSGNV